MDEIISEGTSKIDERITVKGTTGEAMVRWKRPSIG